MSMQFQIDRDNTEAPALLEDDSSTTIFVVCGLVVGFAITAVLFSLMVCKLKLHRVRRGTDRESAKMKGKSSQYPRTYNGDSNTNLKRWRSGYGDEEEGLGVEKNSRVAKNSDASESDNLSEINDESNHVTAKINVMSETEHITDKTNL